MGPLIMNGRGKTLLLIISLAFNLGACLAVAVQGHGEQEPRPSRGDNQRHREWLSSKLNLSPQQAEIVSASRSQLFDELHVFKRRLDEEGGQLAGLLTAPELDMDAVSDKVEEVAAVRDEIQWRMVRHLLSIREVLEPGQLELFKEFAGQVLSGPGRGRRHGDGPPRHDQPEPTP